MKLQKLGARAKVRPLVGGIAGAGPAQSNRDRMLRHDRDGEFFDIQADDAADVEVLDVQPKNWPPPRNGAPPTHVPGLPDIKDSCSAATTSGTGSSPGIPEKAAVSSVCDGQGSFETGSLCETEKQGKKLAAEAAHCAGRRDVFIRQGEWFFIPF